MIKKQIHTFPWSGFPPFPQLYLKHRLIEFHFKCWCQHTLTLCLLTRSHRVSDVTASLAKHRVFELYLDCERSPAGPRRRLSTVHSFTVSVEPETAWSRSQPDGLICLVGGLSQSPASNSLLRSLLPPNTFSKALNCLFNLTHNYCGNICVFCTSATVCNAADAKSSQLPLQRSQPESLIKTRCFHLSSFGKNRSQRRIRIAKPAAAALPWHARRTKRLFPFFFILVLEPKSYWIKAVLQRPQCTSPVNMKRCY